MTEEELEFLINESESEGVIKDFKKDMISGVFEFDETKVREIMTPRPDLNSIQKDDDFDNVVKLSIRTGHSRIPVHDEHLDNIVGVVFAKDLMRLAYSSNGEKPKISDVMREAFYVPESKTIIDVFKDLKRTKNHMAIVIDEHGGTAGIVTMEDILEEIVGEIQDEFDVEEAKILEIDNNIYDVAGSVNIDEFSEFFDLDESIIEDTDNDADTVGGLLTHLLGDLPEVGQKSQLGPLVLEVSEVGRKRIERLRVTRQLSEEIAEQATT
jgi:CBS domain containing-hemolysin-like protein